MKLPIEIKIKDIVITCPVFIKYYVKYCNLLDLKIESANSIKLYLKDVVIHFNDNWYLNSFLQLKELKINIKHSELYFYQDARNNSNMKIKIPCLALKYSDNAKHNFMYRDYQNVSNSALPLLENFDKYLDENFHNK